MGETGHTIFKEEFETGEKEKLQSYLKEIEKKPAATNASAKLGRIIAKLNEKAIKRFLQIIHIDDLAKTVKDMDGQAQIKIFHHLPERGASMLFEAIEQMHSIEHQEIVEAQNKFVAIISELRDQGRI
jgi:flagellar motor switch protein FliG